MDNLNNNAYGSDKCPKCGALKVFSAIRCPSCGTDYAAAARPAASGGNTYVNQPTNNFDLNASFSAYKRSIEPQAEATGEEAAAMGAGVTSAQNVDSSFSNIAELNKPVELDPIARKLQQMSGPGSAAPTGGAAQTAQTARPAYQSTQNMYAQNQSAPIPGVWVPGMQNSGNAGQGAAPAQGQQAAQGAAPQGMRFQGRPTESQVGGYTGAPAASPYSSPNYGVYGGNITEKEKTSKLGLIFKIVLVLAILGAVGYGIYKLYNSDVNEHGVNYTPGSVVNDQYVNEWAELKIDVSGDLLDYTQLIDSIQNDGLTYQLQDPNVTTKGVFLAAKNFTENGKTYTVPAIMVYIINDDSFNAKLGGIKVDDYFKEIRVTGGPRSFTMLKSSDIVLCGQTYKTYVVSMTASNVTQNIYTCIRGIGNKMVVVCLCEITGYFDLSTLKSYFID